MALTVKLKPYELAQDAILSGWRHESIVDNT
jgi:hypothetical protein